MGNFCIIVLLLSISTLSCKFYDPGNQRSLWNDSTGFSQDVKDFSSSSLQKVDDSVGIKFDKLINKDVKKLNVSGASDIASKDKVSSKDKRDIKDVKAELDKNADKQAAGNQVAVAVDGQKVDGVVQDKAIEGQLALAKDLGVIDEQKANVNQEAQKGHKELQDDNHLKGKQIAENDGKSLGGIDQLGDFGGDLDVDSGIEFHAGVISGNVGGQGLEIAVIDQQNQNQEQNQEQIQTDTVALVDDLVDNVEKAGLQDGKSVDKIDSHVVTLPVLPFNKLSSGKITDKITSENLMADNNIVNNTFKDEKGTTVLKDKSGKSRSAVVPHMQISQTSQTQNVKAKTDAGNTKSVGRADKSNSSDSLVESEIVDGVVSGIVHGIEDGVGAVISGAGAAIGVIHDAGTFVMDRLQSVGSGMFNGIDPISYVPNSRDGTPLGLTARESQILVRLEGYLRDAIKVNGRAGEQSKFEVGHKKLFDWLKQNDTDSLKRKELVQALEGIYQFIKDKSPYSDELQNWVANVSWDIKAQNIIVDIYNDDQLDDDEIDLLIRNTLRFDKYRGTIVSLLFQTLSDTFYDSVNDSAKSGEQIFQDLRDAFSETSSKGANIRELKSIIESSMQIVD
ncbi:hypothetical protein [Borrelia persica]|uniref:hypothetical protein n=1 Tax=Borrelia persica TaxID=44448 RepID=UPI0004673B00|nr:hypothetical protein [Borrelia persica]